MLGRATDGCGQAQRVRGHVGEARSPDDPPGGETGAHAGDRRRGHRGGVRKVLASTPFQGEGSRKVRPRLAHRGLAISGKRGPAADARAPSPGAAPPGRRMGIRPTTGRPLPRRLVGQVPCAPGFVSCSSGKGRRWPGWLWPGSWLRSSITSGKTITSRSCVVVACGGKPGIGHGLRTARVIGQPPSLRRG